LAKCCSCPAVIFPFFSAFLFAYFAIVALANATMGKAHVRCQSAIEKKNEVKRPLEKTGVKWKSGKAEKHTKIDVRWVDGLEPLKAIGIVWPTAYLHIYRIYYWHSRGPIKHFRAAHYGIFIQANGRSSSNGPTEIIEYI